MTIKDFFKKKTMKKGQQGERCPVSPGKEVQKVKENTKTK